MNLINVFFKNFKSLLPYLFLISLYFIVVNIEAKKEQNKDKLTDIDKHSEKRNQDIQEKKLIDSIDYNLNKRLRIPVMPYKNNN